jgi:Mn2+/Fe2+ NRAMP family transporter
MNDSVDKIQQDRQLLKEAQAKGIGGRWKTYFRLSGPGWIASANTLGGGSMASSLYLGVLAGFSLLWLQPFAMILGVIMMSAIGYVTLSSGERPFRAINDHVNPVLGWGWALAVAAANVVWSMPQYALANSVLSQNLLAGWLGDDGSLVQWASSSLGFVATDALTAVEVARVALAAGGLPDHSQTEAWLAVYANRVVISVTILIVAALVTSSYDRGGWGLRLYETVLKIMVAMIVLCFLGVIIKLSTSPGGLDWQAVLRGLVPDFGQFVRPAASFTPLLDSIGEAGTAARDYWNHVIVAKQRDNMISAAATAVGINMTLMFPYSMIRKGWTREFRGLSIFDLWTGMFIPYVLATGFVVIAAGAAFHTRVPDGFVFETSEDGQVIAFQEPDVSPAALKDMPAPEKSRLRSNTNRFLAAIDARNAALADKAKDNPSLAEPSLAEKRVAAVLIDRDAIDMAAALTPLTGPIIGKMVFGLGVLGMVLSTISILMLINGFTFAEMTGYPHGRKMHKLGMLISGVGGAMWMFVWTGQSQFYLAVVASVFGFMLLPFAYVTFVSPEFTQPVGG